MMRDYFNKARALPLTQRFKRLVLDTPIEVLIGGVLVGALAGSISYGHQASKRGQLPVAFSGIGNTIMMYKRQGREVPPLTMFYSTLNDSAMQVYESINTAYAEDGGSDLALANALDGKISFMGKHRGISTYAEMMPVYAQKALESVAVLDQVRNDIKPIARALDKAWDYYYREVTRTEYRTEEVCDYDGRNCRTETTSEEVYDHTVHTYDYSRKHGVLAARLLEDFMRKYPHLRMDEQLVFSGEVHEDNRQAIRESRRNSSDYVEPDEREYLELGNVWATGSNYAALLPEIIGAYAGVKKITPQWAVRAAKAKSHQYRTYSNFDSGPQDYQIAEAALEYAVNIAKNSGTITDGMRYASTALPKLSQKINRYVSSVLSIGQDDPKVLRREIIDTAKKVYHENYARGFDVYPSKWGMVVLWSVLGTLVGGGAGYGVDRYINARKRDSGNRPRYW